jgi:hypothetical protein
MISNMGALKVIDPIAWSAAVRKAMIVAAGRIPDAALALGVAERTLYRWLDDPALADLPRVANGIRREPSANPSGKKKIK